MTHQGIGFLLLAIPLCFMAGIMIRWFTWRITILVLAFFGCIVGGAYLITGGL